MGPRGPPGPLDLGNTRFDMQPPRPSFMRDLPSPRTGEVPPALSPLDAFAQHSRMLAAKFSEEQNGRRISRLQPDIVSRELASRPDFFRNTSNETTMDDLLEVQEEERSGERGEVTDGGWKNRPVSHHPRFSTGATEDALPGPLPTDRAPAVSQRRPQADQSRRSQEYFQIPRAASPDELDRRLNVEAPSPLVPSLTNSVESVQSRRPSPPRKLTGGSTKSVRSTKSARSDAAGLAPPKSPAMPRSPHSMQSIRSVRSNSGDDDNSASTGQNAPSSRKFSASSSGMSRPTSPFSPWAQAMDRSPSVTSGSSLAASQALPRPQFNFSRPLSSHGQRPSVDMKYSFDLRPSFDSRASFETRPSLDRAVTNETIPHRHPSTASWSTNGTHPSNGNRSRQNSELEAPPLPFANPALDTPNVVDTAGGDYFTTLVKASDAQSMDDPNADAAPVLPRGRSVKRSSAERRTSWIHNQFNWDNSDAASFKLSERSLTPVRNASQDSQNSSNRLAARKRSPTASERMPRYYAGESERKGRDRAMSSAQRSHSADPRSLQRPPQLFSHKGTPSIQSNITTQTDSTDRTIRPSPLHKKSASTELTAEEHLEIGIQAHSSNELNKSTYHLRLAAKAGLATAMLLYALACRHGWGMRPNQEEGVIWLKKAIESSQLEVADLNGPLSRASRVQNSNPAAEAAERRKRKAQLTHAIYELGQSYMNGWGCKKDTSLGLQCYEVAGSWGDADALAEAGYCYTKGVGKKKDLKKAAELYRKAADAGVSMAGNSWIYKPKYMEAPPAPPSEFRRIGTPTHNDFSNLAKATHHEQQAQLQQGKPSRSRARSIWTRKK